MNIFNNFTLDKFFLCFGLAGQLCFSARFIIQWIYSEKEKKSVIPVAFWYFSLIGGIVLLIYAFYLKNPVFIMGQAPGLFIYSRNIYLIHKNKNVKNSETPRFYPDCQTHELAQESVGHTPLM